MLQTLIMIIDILLISFIIIINLFLFFRSLFGLILYTKFKRIIRIVSRVGKRKRFRHSDAIDTCAFTFFLNILPLGTLFIILYNSGLSINPSTVLSVSLILVFILPGLVFLILGLELSRRIKYKMLKRFEYSFTSSRIRKVVFCLPVFKKDKIPKTVKRAMKLIDVPSYLPKHAYSLVVSLTLILTLLHYFSLR